MLLRSGLLCCATIPWLGTFGFAAQQDTGDAWAAWVKLGINLENQGQFAAAANAAKQALTVIGGLVQNDPRRATTYALLGDIYRGWGWRCGETRANYARSLAIWENQPQPDPERVFTALVSLIGAAISCGEDGPKLLHDRHRELQHLRSGPADSAKILLLQAAVSDRRKHYGEAADLLRQALTILQQAPGDNTRGIAELRYLLSDDLRYVGRYQQSLDEAQRAVASFEIIDPHSPSLPMALNSVACTLFLLGRNEESSQVFQRALDLSRNTFGEETRPTAMVMLNYATVLHALKESSEAQAMERRGNQIWQRASLVDRETVDVEELRAGRR